MAREMDIAPRSMSRIIKQDLGLKAFKRQTRQRLNVALKEDACYRSYLQMKKLLWRKLSLSKTIEFMHGHPRKLAN